MRLRAGPGNPHRTTLQGCKIGRRHVETLMRRMGIEALCRRPRTTKPEPGHKIRPYLLRGLEIARPNQVWAMAITCIPMARLCLSRCGAGLGDTSVRRDIRLVGISTFTFEP
jgi:transposase InsO family protein